MRVRLTGIFVDDQDNALSFYTEKLGFKVKTDAPYAPGVRWLTVVGEDDPAEVELGLQPARSSKEGRAWRDAQRAAGTPNLSLSTDDIQRDYENLREKGVKFTMPPTKMSYGGTDALFDDTCGNLVNLHQE
jgi:predicted enzyme related to lactoylglutathione lyase